MRICAQLTRAGGGGVVAVVFFDIVGRQLRFGHFLAGRGRSCIEWQHVVAQSQWLAVSVADLRWFSNFFRVDP